MPAAVSADAAASILTDTGPNTIFTSDTLMDFRDVPSLYKFQQYARKHTDSEITMDAYRRVRDIIAAAPKANPMFDPTNVGGVDTLKASCAAIEKSTRIIWACAVATDNVTPPMWDYTPDYEDSINYFIDMDDLELMAVTKPHKIVWEHP
ncbi:hypothetical protein DB346_06425 [Verrucomicrobia bacterium LW23]|nr:hypothetical protein DB346_06425 [Verrucomicrobia bacterium LW23]